MHKLVESADHAVRDIPDGATIMLGGFGLCGIPELLIAALDGEMHCAGDLLSQLHDVVGARRLLAVDGDDDVLRLDTGELARTRTGAVRELAVGSLGT